jgi:hypothetical protein
LARRAAGRRTGVAEKRHAKIRRLPTDRKTPPMDVEHINAIGTALADLTQRTQDLRGYL